MSPYRLIGMIIAGAVVLLVIVFLVMPFIRHACGEPCEEPSD